MARLRDKLRPATSSLNHLTRLGCFQLGVFIIRVSFVMFYFIWKPFSFSIPPQGIFPKAKDEEKVKYYGLNPRTKLWQYGSADIIHCQPDCVKERANWYSHSALHKSNILLWSFIKVSYVKSWYLLFWRQTKNKSFDWCKKNQKSFERTVRVTNEPLLSFKAGPSQQSTAVQVHFTRFISPSIFPNNFIYSYWMFVPTV